MESNKAQLDIRLEDLMPLILERLAAGQTVRFAPRGISMLPMLRPGMDAVEFSPAPPSLQKYDLPLYRRQNGEYILHRVIKAGDPYTCIGDNQFILESGIRHSQVLALVTAFYRGDKRYPVTAWHYRLYCRLWHYSRPVRHFWRRGIGWLKRHLIK